MPPSRYRLKLSKLDFISLVDHPAQGTATVRLIKRAPSGDEVELATIARVVKIGAGESPLVHCWAFTCTDETGAPYHDLQGDAISPDDFIKAAEEFMHAGAAVDQMHSGKQTSRVSFAYPMDVDIARGMYGKAIGDQIKTSGLMVAIRPSADALAKLRSGEYTGVSIAGLGTREVVKAGAPVEPLAPVEPPADDTSTPDEPIVPPAVVAPSRVPPGVSTRPEAPPTVESQEQVMPTAEETKIADLAKQVARLEQQNTLTDAQRAHYAQLRAGDAEVFLGKAHHEREAVLKAYADADQPLYKTASGIEIRKSDGPVALELAKQADLAAKQQAVTNELLAKAQAATETTAIEKRAADDLSHFVKAATVHVAIVRAIDGIPDEAIRKEAHEALRAANKAMLALTKSHGGNPGTAPQADTPKAAFDAGLVGFAKSKFKTEAPTTNQLAAATADFLRTAEGSDLYAVAYPLVQA